MTAYILLFTFTIFSAWVSPTIIKGWRDDFITRLSLLQDRNQTYGFNVYVLVSGIANVWKHVLTPTAAHLN